MLGKNSRKCRIVWFEKVSILVVVEDALEGTGRLNKGRRRVFQSLLWWKMLSKRCGLWLLLHHVVFQSLLWWKMLSKTLYWKHYSWFSQFQSLLWWKMLSKSTRETVKKILTKFQSLLWWKMLSKRQKMQRCIVLIGFNPCCGGRCSRRQSAWFNAGHQPPFQSLLWWKMLSKPAFKDFWGIVLQFQSLLWWKMLSKSMPVQIPLKCLQRAMPWSHRRGWNMSKNKDYRPKLLLGAGKPLFHPHVSFDTFGMFFTRLMQNTKYFPQVLPPPSYTVLCISIFTQLLVLADKETALSTQTAPVKLFVKNKTNNTQ